MNPHVRRSLAAKLLVDIPRILCLANFVWQWYPDQHTRIARWVDVDGDADIEAAGDLGIDASYTASLHVHVI